MTPGVNLRIILLVGLRQTIFRSLSETISKRPKVKILETETKTDSLSHDFAIFSRSAYKCLQTRIVTEIRMSTYVRTIKKRTDFGREVRVKWEIEDLISGVSQLTGYLPFTVRNVAILYGLQSITKGAKMPENDNEFKQLLQVTAEEIEKSKVVG